MTHSLRLHVRRFAIGFAALMTLGLMPLASTAQTTYTWNGAGGDNNWSTAANWGGTAPVSDLTNTLLAFGGTTRLTNTLDMLFATGGGIFDVNTVTFNANAGAFTINPTGSSVTSLRIGAGGIAMLANANNPNQTIAAPIFVGGLQSWTNNTTGTLNTTGSITATGQTFTLTGGGAFNIQSPITGGTLNKSGAGTATLRGNNTLAGLNVSAGVLAITPTITANNPLGLGPVGLSGGTLSFRRPGSPLAFQGGFNHDVISTIDESVAYNGDPAGYVGTTNGLDGTGTGGFVFYEVGANVGIDPNGQPYNVGGLPGKTTRTWTSLINPAMTYQLQPYEGQAIPDSPPFPAYIAANNTLQLRVAESTTGNLNIANASRSQFRSISITHTSGNGAANYTITLRFTDGTTTGPVAVTAPDWFNAANPVLTNLGRLARNGAFEPQPPAGPSPPIAQPTNPRIYAFDYVLSPGDQAKTLASVDFALTSTGGQFLNIMGISAVSASGLGNSQTYTNPVNVTGNATIEALNSGVVTLGPLTVANNTLTLTTDPSSSLVFGGTTAGASTLTVSAASTANFGNTTFSGNAVINSAGSTTFGTVGFSGTATINSTAGAGTILGATTLGGNATFNPSGAVLNIASLNDGGTARTITKNGGNVLTLPGAGSLTNGTVVNMTAGTMNLNNATSIGTGSRLNQTGGTTNLNAAQQLGSLNGTGGTINFNANTLTINGADNQAGTYAGLLNNGTGTPAAPSLIVTGANAQLTLSNTGNGFTGGTQVLNGGRLTATLPGALGSGAVTLGTATLNVGAGAPPVTVTGFNNDGTGWNRQGNAAGPPTIAGNVLTLTTAQNDVTRTAWYQQAVVVNQPFNLSFRYSQSVSGNPADGMAIAFQRTSNTAVGTGGGGLGINGIANKYLFAMNVYDPNTRGFQFRSNADAAGPYTPATGINFLTAQPGNEITVNLAYDGTTLTGSLVQGANTFTLPAQTVNIASVIGGSTAFFGFTGATGGLNTQQVISNFTSTIQTPDFTVYSNNVSVQASQAGTIGVIAAAASPNVRMGTLTTGAGSTLNVAPSATGSTANQAYGLTLGATTMNGNTTFNVANNGSGLGTLTLGGVSGTGSSLTKTGAGTLILNAANTYTGQTFVNQGVLTVQSPGTLGNTPAIAVAAGATLNVSGMAGGGITLTANQAISGNGTIAGNLTVGATGVTGSTVAPGASVGTLNHSGTTLTFGPNGVYQFEYNKNNGTFTPGTDNDYILSTGAFALTATGANPFTINLSYIGDPTAVVTGPVSMTIATFGSAPTIDPAAFTFTGDFRTLPTIEAQGNNIVLNFTPVPEPATLLAISAGLVGVGRLVSRRRKQTA